MKPFDVRAVLFDRIIELTIMAESCDEAVERFSKMNVVDVLNTLRMEDVHSGYSIVSRSEISQLYVCV